MNLASGASAVEFQLEYQIGLRARASCRVE